MPTAQVLLDTTQYVRITSLSNRAMLQCLRDAVRIVLSESKPAVSNSSFHLLSGADMPLQLDAVDNSIWALATTKTSSLVITETSSRLRVSSEDVVDTQTLAGKTQAVTSVLSVADGGSTCFRLDNAGPVFLRQVFADGLTVKHVKNVTGTQLSLGNSNSLNLSIDSGFVTYYTILGDVTYSDSDVVVAGDSPFTVGVFTLDSAFVVLENNTGVDVTTEVSIILQPDGDFTLSFGLKSDSNLQPTTEMSDYA